MANHKSAEKRIRQNIKRRARNRSIRTRVGTQTKSLRGAIIAGNAETTEQQLRLTMRELNKAASKGVLKKKTASRRIARLAKAVHAAQI
ncbi:MAG: 30S ribosomal protein S20 [Candidatus Lernaella stagnicola]|nr:30S ribosomal protein S20 [Candidatus Lernaella stagnicola]